MKHEKPTVRCGIYTRKSHEEGLDQDFNSLDAQRDAAESYIASQRHEGWQCLPDRYDDGGYSGGTMERPALAALMADVQAGRIDCVVVYKVDRLSRSLLDFSKLISLFDEYSVSFVSVTQQFNTTTSMGRLTLNILLSFAQFEREIIGERIRDKKLATARQGKFIGGQPVLGLDVVDRRYVVNEPEAEIVRRMFKLLLKLESCRKVAQQLNAEGIVTKRYTTKTGKDRGGKLWTDRSVYEILIDQKYVGKIVHKGVAYPSEHPAIVEQEVFDRVHATMVANRRWTHKHQVKRFALLRRLVRCGECGGLVQPVFTNNNGREYRYYNCMKRVKEGYGVCPLPNLPAGELETVVLTQVWRLLSHPDIVARTCRELERQALAGDDVGRQKCVDDLQQRRRQTQESIRTLVRVTDHGSEFLDAELKRLNGELKSLERALQQVTPATDDKVPIEPGQVAERLQRVHDVWDALYPEEQRRILEILVDSITVSKDEVELRFRPLGIHHVIHELNE